MKLKTVADTRDRDEILRRISTLSENDARQWGKMTIHQMICHLDDSYSLALNERKASPATGFLQQTVIKWVALWVPLKWMKGFPTRPELEQGKGGSAPVEFAADRMRLAANLDRFCGALPYPCIRHPVFGPMTREDWQRWGYLHADHHLRQFGR